MSVADVCEKINSSEFSLKKICAVYVAHRVLECVGVKKGVYRVVEDLLNATEPIVEDILHGRKRVVAEAAKRVEKLDLPSQVKQLVAGLIIPIFHELQSWYNYHQFDVAPIWSPHGTVDMVRSTRTVVEDPKSNACLRFLVACEFCHERQISEIAQLLTDREKAFIKIQPGKREGCVIIVGIDPDFDVGRQWNPLARLWLDVVQRCGSHLTQEACEAGLDIAIKNHKNEALRYFLKKGHPEGMRRFLDERYYFNGWLNYNLLSPATCFSLFSKLSDDDLQLSRFEDLVYHLLKILTQWPYQPLLLDVTRCLSVRVSDKTLFLILCEICHKPSDGYQDFDYRGLFVGFWEMTGFPKPGQYYQEQVCPTIAYEALCTEDELWMKFVFGKYSDRDKEILLLADAHSNICKTLVSIRKPHLLEPFIRLCGANRIDLLLKFRDTFRLPEHVFISNSHSKTERDVGQRLISQIVHKIIDELLAEAANVKM